MATNKIDPPSPGQPIDYSYLNTVANAINQVSAENTGTVSSISGASGQNKRQTKEVKIVTMVVDSTITGDSKDEAINFSETFSTAPVVTITPLYNKTSSSDNIFVSINSVGTTSVNVKVTYPNNTLQKTVKLHVIAIGEPVNTNSNTAS